MEQGEGQMERSSLKWSDQQLDYLIGCMLEQARIPGMKSGGALKGKAMRAVEKKMMKKFGEEYNLEKIKNKLKRAKPNMHVCKEMLKTDGFAWNDKKKQIEVDDSVWKSYVQKYPSRRPYRNADKWKYYKEFSEIYEDTTAVDEHGEHGATVAHDTPCDSNNDDQSMEQEEVQSERDSSLTWSSHQVDYLIECMLDQARMPGTKAGGGLKLNAMMAVAAKMMDRFGPDYNLDKIKNKLKRARPNLRVCKELLNTAGFSWNSEKKCIEVDDAVWREYIKAYPSRRPYRNPDKWKYYEQLAEIYDESSTASEGRDAMAIGTLCEAENDDQFTQDEGQSDRNGTLKWSDYQVDYLITCMLEQARIPGMKLGGKLRGKAMREVEGKMIERFGSEYNLDKIKNKLKRARPNMHICKEILNTNGFLWNKEKKQIQVDDAVWSDYVQRYPSRRQYRDADKWKYFEEFLEIFEEPTTVVMESHEANNSAQCETLPPPQSVDEMTSYTSLAQDEEPVQSLPPNEPSFGNKPETKESSDLPATGRMQISEMLGNLCQCVKSFIDASSLNLINKCGQILKEMHGKGEINDDFFMKSLDLFEDSNKAAIFLNLQPNMRVGWLSKKISQL
ncbi:unnamed protein product [Victoria cruziana]